MFEELPALQIYCPEHGTPLEPAHAWAPVQVSHQNLSPNTEEKQATHWQTQVGDGEMCSCGWIVYVTLKDGAIQLFFLDKSPFNASFLKGIAALPIFDKSPMGKVLLEAAGRFVPPQLAKRPIDETT